MYWEIGGKGKGMGKGGGEGVLKRGISIVESGWDLFYSKLKPGKRLESSISIDLL